MEILSVGEKIKRARVYKGITLKDLVGDKLSISKLSCIENGKIKATNEMLMYIAERLELDYDYLVMGAQEEVINNIDLIKNGDIKEDHLAEVINYNLEYAMNNSYNQEVFELMHIKFNNYIELNDSKGAQETISRYYDVYQKNNNSKNTIIYYLDKAKFLYNNKEYEDSLSYYKNTKKYVFESVEFDKETYAYICYRQAKCYDKLFLFKEAYEVLEESLNYIKDIVKQQLKGNIYSYIANVGMKLKVEDFNTYLELAYEYQKDDNIVLARSKQRNAESYFYINEIDKAIKEIEEAIELFPSKNKSKQVKFLLTCLNTLYNNKQYDTAFKFIDATIDYSISLNDTYLIEEAYYLKGMLSQKKGLYMQAEMYMNLSLDSIFKYGNNKKRYDRYLDMAYMYYNMGDLNDSLKYFLLAMKIKI